MGARWPVLCVFLLISACASHGEKSFFPVGEVPMASVDDAMARAAATDRLALIILGANWCHDSQSLMEKLEDPAIAPVMAANYEVALVNVGWLEEGFDVAQRFGVPVYTHTPTVLIVDPRSGRLLNAHDHFIWRDAAKMSVEETRAYFEAKAGPSGWAPEVKASVAADPAYQQLMAEIAAFEAGQAGRIRTAYGLIGPGMASREKSAMAKWAPLRELRYRLPDDVKALKDEAARRVGEGETEIRLDYPSYPAFPWESA